MGNFCICVRENNETLRIHVMFLVKQGFPLTYIRKNVD